jgi:hypothetical protein
LAVPAAPGLACNSKAQTSQDRANGVVSGTLTAVGPGKAFAVWGPMNLVVYGVVAQALTIGASGTNSGTVAADTYLTVGDAVNSTLAPPGTTVLTKNGAGT